MGFKRFSSKWFTKGEAPPKGESPPDGTPPEALPPPQIKMKKKGPPPGDLAKPSPPTKSPSPAPDPASAGQGNPPSVKVAEPAPAEPASGSDRTAPQVRPVRLAVVLLSGGMDSLATAGVARRDGFDLALIHFNYGQRTEEAELRAFRRLADFLEVPAERRLVAHTNFFAQAGGSALTDTRVPVPEADLSRKDVPPTYVPFRNAVLLSMAAAWAETLGATAVYYGAVSADSSGYPDCRPSFVNAFNRLVSEGTKSGPDLVVRAPLVDLTKAQIVLLAMEMGLPLELSWSCYTRNDRACGACDSCALRRRGFEQAGIPDPTPYAPTPQQMAEERQRKLDAARRLARLMNALTRPPP